MKKTAVCIIFVATLFGVCFAQSGSMKDRIVGTWVDNRNQETWIFCADGKLKNGDGEFIYDIIETELTYKDEYKNEYSYDITISSDGKTLIGKTGRGSNIWLTKKQR